MPQHGVFRLAQEEAQEPKWRDAMSEMLPDQAKALGADSRQRYSDKNNTSNWLDRWVDVAQVGPPPVTELRPGLIVPLPAVERKSEPMISPRIVIFVCFGFILILAAVELVFRNLIFE
ncbi:MAG: hypothetical protein ACLQDM_27870 [Bradyrhizobium sp.]